MAKYLIYADPHWSQYSSIVRSRGAKYSTRLEYLIKAVSWVERMADKYNCEGIICLGDFFDKETLSSEEITALKEVSWNNRMKHYFLCGNHEMGNHSHEFSSANVFSISGLDNYYVVNKHDLMWVDNYLFHFIPYILPNELEDISNYLAIGNSTNVVFCHSDLKGIRMGSFISKDGFDVEELSKYTYLTFNGHIHSGSKVADNVINVGSLMPQNFGQNSFECENLVYIFDTENGSYKSIENPYAFNFYSVKYPIDVNELREPMVVSVTCSEDDIAKAKEDFEYAIASRFLISSNKSSIVKDKHDFELDHLKEFKDFVTTNIGEDDLIMAELEAVCR